MFPRKGSFAGGTKLVIQGTGNKQIDITYTAQPPPPPPPPSNAHGFCNVYILGFSADQFAFDDPTLGNKVTLVSARGVVIPCSVVETDTSPERISCETG
jgi:hypothetical protein